MTTKFDNSAPAFPCETPNEIFSGITMRDYFAAKALDAYVVGSIMRSLQWSPMTAAEEAYCMADAMLAAREK